MMTMNDDMNITPIRARRFAQYIDHNGDPQSILVSSTETEEDLQRHFESTVGKRLHILGFYWDTDAQPKKYQIGTLDDAQESAILLGCENAKLRDALKLIMNNPKHGGYWCAEQATWALRLYADGCANINPNANK